MHMAWIAAGIPTAITAMRNGAANIRTKPRATAAFRGNATGKTDGARKNPAGAITIMPTAPLPDAPGTPITAFASRQHRQVVTTLTRQHVPMPLTVRCAYGTSGAAFARKGDAGISRTMRAVRRRIFR